VIVIHGSRHDEKVLDPSGMSSVAPGMEDGLTYFETRIQFFVSSNGSCPTTFIGTFLICHGPFLVSRFDFSDPPGMSFVALGIVDGLTHI
jgi:hypothetical protein